MSDAINIFQNKPEDFFCNDGVVLHNIALKPGISGLNVGYEESVWRYDEFAEYLIEWLPEFALKYSDVKKINYANARQFLKKAAKTVYQTDKYQNRGEFGELILHALIRCFFNSQPAISKIYYKTAANDTIKGFDAVHVVEHSDGLELWLGEAKFYKNIDQAISDVIGELRKHIQRNYLKDEFLLIEGKIDEQWHYAEQLKKLLSSRHSLDQLFTKISFPVLLTYESTVIKNHKAVSDEFIRKLKEEILSHYNKFKEQLSNDLIKIHLILLPLEYKQTLVNTLNSKLEGLQK